MRRCTIVLVAPVLLLAVLCNARPALESRDSTVSTQAGQQDVAVVTAPASWASRHLLRAPVRPPTGPPCAFKCDDMCAVCVDTVVLKDEDSKPTGFKQVTVDAQGCAGPSETLGWICCKGASDDGNLYDQACTLKQSGCVGRDDAPIAPDKYEYGKQKCDGFQKATFVVPVNSTWLSIQVQDRRANGNLDCSVNDCCGSGGSTCASSSSAVCDWKIDLATEACVSVTVGTPPECEIDAQCTLKNPANECAVAKCEAGVCVDRPIAAAANFVCREVSPDEPCDVREVCDGTNLECPADRVQTDTTFVCRAANGTCDVAETCDGFNKTCPMDAYKKGDVCRAAPLPCDKEEKCLGNSPDCPEDDVMEAGVVCRKEALGGCDVEEKCDGKNKTCPPDAYKTSDYVCRESKGDCDQEEKCTGTGPLCPLDVKKPTNHVCRPRKDNCDLPEMCAGDDSCPDDRVLRDKAKVFKCGRDCFYCGMPVAPVGANIMATTISVEMTQLKNTWALGSCNTGSCDRHILIQETQGFTPAQIGLYCGDTLPLVCPNGKALSNVIHGVCNPETGKWGCMLKQDGPFFAPVMAPWTTP